MVKAVGHVADVFVDVVEIGVDQCEVTAQLENDALHVPEIETEIESDND